MTLIPQNEFTSTRPSPGHVLRDYQLNDATGNAVMLSDHRGKANLVLIAADGAANLDSLLRELDARTTKLREYETQVLVIGPRVVGREFSHIRILTDEHGEAIRDLGAPAVYVTDKFREVVHRFDGLPTAEDVLGWVEFTAMQCPECHPPEWPVIDS